MKLCFVSIVIFITSILHAQTKIDFNHYQPLKCAGTIPADFRTLSQVKYKADVKEEIKTAPNHNVSKAKDDFFLRTDFAIDELLLSGKVLFGDTVTNYVNRVADKVLADDPELRGKLRFYCLRSSEANAFSTNQGIVFVTLGLISQLENEAQLAFILSHEIAHYERHHSINEYLEDRRIMSEQVKNKYNTYDDQIRAASTYSKDLELEADSLGIKRISKTGYDCSEVLGAFFVLQFSELPFEDYEFDASFLENPVMKLPADLFLDSVRPINLENDMKDDSYSTHPNVATRRAMAEGTLDRISNCGNQKFASAPEEFYTIRKICRFETVRIMLDNREYCNAFYNSYILQHEDSTSLYLETCIGKALYGMAKYKNHGQYSDVSEYYGKKEGNQQQVFHLFGTLKDAPLNMIALRYLYELSRIDSSYPVIAMRNDLAEEAVEINSIHYADMQKTYALFLDSKKILTQDTVKKKDTAQVVVAEKETTTGFVSKYDKLREAKKKKDIQDVTEVKKSDASKYYLMAFADIEDREDVKQMFGRAENKFTKKSEEEAAEKERHAKMTPRQVHAEDLRKEALENAPKDLGIDTVVYVDPFYLWGNPRGIRLIDSENAELAFSKTIEQNAVSAHLNISLLDPKSFSADDVDKYNDFAAVNDWMDERLDHDDAIGMVPLETDRMTAVSQKYHTTHFCYTGVYTYTEKHKGRGAVLLLTILCWPLLPVGIVYAVAPAHHTYYYTLLYDVRNGNPDLVTTMTMHGKNSVNPQMHSMMTHIKKHKAPVKPKP